MLGPRKPLGGQYVGAGGALVTPEQVAQQKQIAAALLEQAGDTSPVGHWSAAVNRGLQGWLGGRDMYRARQSESEGTSKALERFNARNSGAGAASRIAEALAGGVAAGQPVSGNESGFLASLVASESGGNWNALNKEGYGGRLQFGAARLADAARAGVIPAAITGAEFSRLSPEQQMAVEQWHFNDIDQQAERMGLGQYIGQTVAGIPITREAIRGMAHLGGIGGAAKFLQSGGRYNPADSNGTSLADYALRHGGAGAGVSSGPSPRNVSEISELLADPWLPKDAKAVLQAEMNQQMQMQNAAYEYQLQQQDPLRQIQLQQERLKLEQMLNPAPVVPEAPETQVFFDEETGQDYRAQWNPQTMTWERVGGMKAPGGPLVQVGGDGMMGAVPAGMEVFLNSEGRREMRPIVGSEQWIAEQNKGKAAEKAEEVQSLEGATIMRSAGQALQASRNRLLGGFGQNVMSELMPWSEAADTARYVGTLKANASLGNLQAMRESSPTGAALGSITERELATLESKSGALDPSSKNFERDLEDYTRTLFETIHGTDKGRELFEKEWASISNPQGATTNARPITKSEYDALPSGSIFVDPNGVKRRKP